MKIFKQLGILLVLCLLAEFFVSLLPVSFPSSVMAILMLALLLIFKVIQEHHIRETADFLLANMALVFVPIAVRTLGELDVLKGKVAGFLLVVVCSLILTFLGTYASVRVVQRCQKKILSKKAGKKDE